MATIKTTIKRRNGTGWDELRPKTEVDQITDFDANVPSNLDDLTNVNAPSPSNGQALVWDNSTSKWVPGTVETPEFASSYTTIASNGWNDYALGRGIFSRSNSSGLPSGGTHGYWLTLGRRDVLGGYAGIYVNDYSTSGSGVYIGRNDSGGNPTWEKVWTDKTDGSGSGLDADTLDGSQATSFVRSDTTDYYTRLLQSSTGVPTNNLGGPSITEMALFQEQFNNKTAFYTISNLKFYTSSDGTNWTEYTSFSDTNKRKFLGGDNNSGIIIPNLTDYFRIELTNNGNYVYLNALYMYWSSNSHNTTVKIRKQRGDGVWSQHTNSSTTVSSWPGHLYLPFSTIPFHPSTTSTSHYRTIHIDFEPNWSGHATYGSYNINLYRMQIWGGYPAGKRTLYTVDEYKRVIFPEDVRIGGDSKRLDLARGTTSSQPKIIVGEQGTYGLQLRWDSGTKAHFDRFWSTSIDGTPSSQMMTFDIQNDRIGIGTTSPNSKLHILDANPILVVQDTETAGASSDARLRLAESTTGNVIDQYWDIKKEGDNLKFSNKYGTTIYDRFTIDGTNGNVGIGTTSPDYNLNVEGSSGIGIGQSSSTHDLILSNRANYANDTSNSHIWISSGSTGAFSGEGAHMVLETRRSARNIYFKVGDVTAPQHIMNYSGNVGIGTTSPSQKLDVSGNIAVSGTVDGVDIAAFKTAYDSHAHSQYAPLASPALTGTPTAPTAATNTNNTQIATTAFVSNKIAGIAGGLNFKGTVSLATSKSGDDLYGTGSGQISSSGDYVIVSNAGDITNPTTRIITLAAQSPGDESDSTLPITLEVGDWIMYQSFSSQTLTVVLLNNNDASKAAAVHTHSQYLEKAGGTMTGELIIDNSTTQRIRLYTESGTSQIADTFADTTTDKSYIYFDAGTSSNDPGFIMHETSNSETNEGVLHLVPSDDNSYGDYVSIHGTNDPDKIKLHTDGTIEGVSNLSLSGNITVGGTVDGVDVAAFKTAYDSHNHDHSDGNFTVNGDLYGKSVNGQYSNLYRFGGIYFTWDSDSYGTNTNHSIRSTYGDSYGDHITLNSYGHIRMNIDSNNNGTNYFEVGGHTTGTSNTYFQISDTGTTIFPGLSLGISNTNADPGTGTYFRGNSTHFVLGLDSGNTLYLNYGNSAGNFRTYGTHYHNDNAVGTPWGSSNDGSGSGLDADTLDGIDSTSFLRSDADDTMTGDLLLSNAALSYQGQNGVAVPIPQGGLFATTSSTQTGYLKITLPVSWTSTMLSFFVDIYEYTADESFTLQLAGYNYSSSSQWINTTANLVSSSTNRVFNVRFGHDGSKCAIYIGESTSTWSYMQVRVRDFLGGYSNANPSNWADGWAVGFTTTLGTITSTQSLESEVTNADTADKWTTARTITLGGDLSGSVSLDGSANVTLTAAVADDSHNHTIANIDNLQTTLNAKQDSFGDVSTTILPTNGQVLKWNASASEWQPGDDNNTDTNTTYSAGSGLSLSGTTFSHSDTSSQASVNNSGTTFIQDITLDTYGHITGLASHTLTNNVSGSTFQNAYAAPGGGTNTGVLLYGDYYGWHTRSIGSQGQVLRVGSLGTPVWEDGTWTLINSGLDSVYSSGTTDKTVTTGEAIEGAIYAVEIVLSSTAGYTRQILQFTLGGTSTSSFSSIGTVLYSTTSYNRPLAVKVRRQDGNTIEFGYGYSVALDSTPSFAADFIYIGRIWKIGDYDY